LIYSDIAATLADARQYMSSLTQLAALDKVTLMIADTLSEYKRFNKDHFITKCKFGYGVPTNNEME